MADDDVTADAVPLTPERRYIQRLRWYLTLRWVGVVVLYASGLFARELADLDYSQAASNVLAPFVLAYNVAVWRLVVAWEKEPPVAWERKYRLLGNAQCSLDLLVLGIALHFSGGIETTTTFSMVAVLVVAGLVLSGRDSIAQGVWACALFDFVVVSEARGWFDHVELEVLRAERVTDAGYVAGVVVSHNMVLLFIVGLVVFIADRLRAREQELVRLYAVEREAVLRLEQLDRLKSHFLATVSHELRTPLTAIMGFTRTITRGEGERSQAERSQLEAIDRQSRRLHRLVEDLLALSAVEAGEVPLRREPVDLAELVSEVTDECGEHDVAIEVPPGLVVDVDRDRVHHVVLGLVDNAIKYGEAPRRLSARRDGSVVVLCVEDSGRGVPAELADDIWDRFRQADLSPTRRGGGAGLGLALVKGMVEVHGGRAWHVRDQGVTRFCITLPVADEVAVASRVVRGASEPPSRPSAVDPSSSSPVDPPASTS